MYFSAAAPRQGLDELDHARHLVSRQALLRPVHDIVAVQSAPRLRLQRDERLHRLASPRVGRRDDGDFLDVGMLVERHLDFGGPHLESRRVDRRRASVVDVKLDLRGDVHRIDGNDDSVAAQNGVERDDELGAALCAEEHAIAAPDAAPLLQKPRERRDIARQLPIHQPRVVEDRCGLVRIPRRRHLEVVANRRLRECQTRRQVLWPDAGMVLRLQKKRAATCRSPPSPFLRNLKSEI